MTTLLEKAKSILPAPISSRKDLRQRILDAVQLFYRVRTLETQADKDIAQIKKTYAGAVAGDQKRYKQLEKSILTWAEENRADEFNGKQSLVIDGHKIQFRKGTGKVVHELKDEDAGELIFSTDDDELIKDCIRFVASPDKTVIKAVIEAGGENAEKLQKLGFSVDYGEKLTFSPAEISLD
jgi:ATP-dependent helicase/DNAse subunit B